MAGRAGMKVLSILVGIPVGKATKRLVDKTWVAARPEDPPRETHDTRARWTDAVGWAALSAAGAALAEILTRRGAEASYRSIFRSEPPPPKPTKAEKKAQKALEKDEQKAAL